MHSRATPVLIASASCRASTAPAQRLLARFLLGAPLSLLSVVFSSQGRRNLLDKSKRSRCWRCTACAATGAPKRPGWRLPARREHAAEQQLLRHWQLVHQPAVGGVQSVVGRGCWVSAPAARRRRATGGRRHVAAGRSRAGRRQRGEAGRRLGRRRCAAMAGGRRGVGSGARPTAQYRR